MTTTKTIFSIAFLLSSIALYSQSFIGLTQDHYSGIQGVLLNPAKVQNSPYKVEFNLISTSVQGAVDAFEVNFSELLNNPEYSPFDTDNTTFKENNFANVNLDVIAPSVFFKLGKKSSLGIFTRGRLFVNINGINGELADEIDAIGGEVQEPFFLEEDQFNITANSWAEIGLTYGQQVLATDRHLVQLGVTAKFLQGLGTANFKANDLAVDYRSDTDISVDGDITYNYSENVDLVGEEDLSFSIDTESRGVAFDFGLIYELKKGSGNSSHNDGSDTNTDNASDKGYIFQVGVSVTDIGKISYKNAFSQSYNFDFDLNFDEDTFEEEDIFELVEELDVLSNPESQQTIEVSLPTTLRAYVDFNPVKFLFLNAGINSSLIPSDQENANRYFNALIIAPRFQTKWITLGSSFVFREHTGFTSGANLRLGPLVIGSGSVLSNLFSKNNSNATDIYLGLKVSSL